MFLSLIAALMLCSFSNAFRPVSYRHRAVETKLLSKIRGVQISSPVASGTRLCASSASSNGDSDNADDVVKHIEDFSAEPARPKEVVSLPSAEERKHAPLFDLSDIRMGKFGNETRRALAVDMPRVIPPGTVGNNRNWLMWLSMRDSEIDNDVIKGSTGRICFATSRDGLTNWKFDEDSPIMGPNKENGDWFYFDAEHIGLGDVIQPGDRAQNKFNTMGGVFLMYVFGGRNEAEEIGGHLVKGSRLEIGVCVSQDGAHWSRVEGPSPYGAIVECGKKESGDFDIAYAGWPSVIEIGNNYRMYYHSYDRTDGKFKLGLALASDGLMNWKKKGVVFAGSSGGEFDARGVTRRFIANMEDGTYAMWYEGISASGEPSIGYATSADGVAWQAQTEPVFTANRDDAEAWDGGGVGSPHLVWVPARKVWRMYYTGSSSSSSSSSRRRQEEGVGKVGHHDDTLEGREVFPTRIGAAESLDASGLTWKRV